LSNGRAIFARFVEKDVIDLDRRCPWRRVGPAIENARSRDALERDPSRFRGPEARVGTLDTRNLHLISVTIDWAGDSDALASILSLHRHNDIIE